MSQERVRTGNADELIYEEWALLTYLPDKDLSNRASQHPCEVDTIIPGWVNWGTHRQSREWKLRWESRDPWCHRLLWAAFPFWRRRHLALCWKVGETDQRDPGTTCPHAFSWLKFKIQLVKGQKRTLGITPVKERIQNRKIKWVGRGTWTKHYRRVSPKGHLWALHKNTLNWTLKLWRKDQICFHRFSGFQWTFYLVVSQEK